MKRVLRILAWITFAAIAVAIVVRAAVVANRVEGGWEILGEHLTAGLPPVVQQSNSSDRPAADWRWKQAERTKQDPHATVNDLLCAAQLLASSTWRIVADVPPRIGRAMWGSKPYTNPTAEVAPVFDRERKSRELAARATDLAPMDVDVWRARILLLCEGSSITWPMVEYWDETGSILRAAMNVDRSNALYDYLLGIRCYAGAQSTVDRETPEGTELVTIVDPDRLLDSQDHYQAGFAQPEYASRSHCFDAMAEYLRRAPGPILAKLNMGDAGVAGPEFLQTPFDGDQILEADNLDEIDGINLWFVQHNFDARLNSQRGPAERSVFSDYIRLLRSPQLSDSDARWLAAMHAWQRNYGEELEHGARWSALTYVAVMASALGWALCGAVVLAAVTTWLLRGARWLNADAPRSVLCYSIWLVSLATTIAGQGFLCAQVRLVSMSSPASQISPWFVIWAIIGVVVCAIAATFWIGIRFVLRQAKRRREDRSILFNWARLGLAVIGNLLILIPLLCVADPKIRRNLAMTWSELPRAIHLEWRVSVPAIPSDRVSDALLQWGGHYGLLLTLGLWIVLLMIFRRRASLGTKDDPASRLFNRFTGALRGVARAGLPLAAIMFLISIATTTEWMVNLQAMYERQLVRLANPRWEEPEIDALVKPLETPLTDSGDGR
jgi:hypothetical protein